MSFAASRHGILLTSGINSLGNMRCVPAELQWDRVFLSVHLLWREALQSWAFLHFATCKSLTMAAPSCMEEGNSKSLFSGPLSYSSNSHLAWNMNWDNRHQKKKEQCPESKIFPLPREHIDLVYSLLLYIDLNAKRSCKPGLVLIRSDGIKQSSFAADFRFQRML